jgi:hypothetical protein
VLHDTPTAKENNNTSQAITDKNAVSKIKASQAPYTQSLQNPEEISGHA